MVKFKVKPIYFTLIMIKFLQLRKVALDDCFLGEQIDQDSRAHIVGCERHKVHSWHDWDSNLRTL